MYILFLLVLRVPFWQIQDAVFVCACAFHPSKQVVNLDTFGTQKICQLVYSADKCTNPCKNATRAHRALSSISPFKAFASTVGPAVNCNLGTTLEKQYAVGATIVSN